ncbi:MAG: LysM peptidoglycan-binding domain-containing protein [Hyphomicrobiales bacterium]|nr:MAG: LysM peptidoglycan-binding domain-containing protein [Hyphomicrobiales bacterium]
MNDAQGNALYVNQGAGTPDNKGGRIQNLPSGYIGGFIGNALHPGHVQRQLVANGEVMARFGDAPDSQSPPANASDVVKYVSTAEFNLNAPPLQLKGANLSAMSYTVVGGETLKSIARTVLGDSSLWWRIAEANGLAVSADGALTAGQTLSIPKLSLNANNSDTFQPYDPAKVTGSQDSVLPAPAGKGGGCGGFGQFIVAVVAVVVAVVTQQYYLAQYGWVGAAASGAAGSIASQVVGNAIGVQDGFSWKSVGISALSAGITQGVDVGNVIANAAIANVATQGIAVVTGLQDKFNWRAVAASAVGAAAGSAVGDQLGKSTLFEGWNPTAAAITAGTMRGFAAGTAAAIARGGRVVVQQVATDAFGNALGSSLAAGIGQMAGSASGTGEDRLGAFIEQNLGSWNQRQANYDQMVDAFGNPTAYDRDNDVLLAAGPGYSGGIGSGMSDRDTNIARMLSQANEPEAMGSVVPPYRVEIRGIGSTGLGNEDRWIPNGNSDLDGGTVVGRKMTQPEMDEFDRLNPGVNELGSGSINGIGEVENFFTFNPAGRAIQGAGSALYDTWTALPRAVMGVGNLARDAVGYASNAIAPQRSVLTGQPFPYQPKSAMLQSIQQQGVLGTLGAGITGAVRNAPGIGLIGALGSPNREWGNIGAQVLNSGAAMVGAAASMRGSSVGAPVTRSANPLSPVLEFDAYGNEIMYRSMSRDHYRHLLENGELFPTKETFISPDFGYAANYTQNDSVTVRFATKPGTSAALQEIGIAAGPRAAQALGLVERPGKWMQTNTRFKVEGDLMNTGLGQGPGVKIFNHGIVEFERVR